MKNTYTILKYMMSLALMVFILQACDNDNGPVDLNIVSMTVGGEDLNGAVSPGDVAPDASVVITFNSDIKAETATSSNITLVQDYDDTNIELTITVDGPMLTITPTSALGSGTLYNFTVSMGLLNTDDQPLASTSRTFTTEGTFSPSGMIANWTFEETSEDIVGDYDPLASGVVDITYTASRNTAAGTAATFNGNTSIIEIPGADVLVTTSDFTISFWMKTNSDGHVNENDDPAGHFVMGLGAFFGLQFEVFGGYNGAKFAIQYEFADATTGAEDMWFPVEATDNTNGGWQGWDFAKSITQEQMEGYLKDTWTQITYTYDGADKKGRLYYNSELMKSFDFDLWPDDAAKKTTTGLTYAGQEPDVVNDLAFGFVHSRAGTMWDDTPWGGYANTTANHFKGQLDDIKIYHKVLTETEIQLMYTSEN